MLSGVNIEATVGLARPSASRSSPAAARVTRRCGSPVRRRTEGVTGAITGRAIYEGTLDSAPPRRADELSTGWP